MSDPECISWAQFEQEARENDELFVGRCQGDLTEIAPAVSETVAIGPENMRIEQEARVFATRSLAVAIFAGAVWSHDGWSGWYTYEDEAMDGGVLHDYFAIPIVLREALDREGFVYRVPTASFEPGDIPGEYIAAETVPVCGQPKRANILDMPIRILESAYMHPSELRAREFAAIPPLTKEDILSLSPRDPRHLGNGYDIFHLL